MMAAVSACFNIVKSRTASHDNDDYDHAQHMRLAKRPRISLPPGPSRLTSFVPPLNFGVVEPSIFRSGYPTDENFAHIAFLLRIKTIITLVPEPLSSSYVRFLELHNIGHVQIHVPANKDGHVSITQECMNAVLAKLLDRNNHPVLIHCNRGKHRTGCAVACFRKVQGQSIGLAISEYTDFATPKVRADDVAFIESFDTTSLMPLAERNDWAISPIPDPAADAPEIRRPGGAVAF